MIKMKPPLFLVICCYIFLNGAMAQTFNASSGVPVDLDAGSTNYSSCISPGNKSNIQFSVSGLTNPLSSANALTNIKVAFDASCGGNLQDIALYIKSPSGTCMRIYNGAGVATSYTGNINVSLRDGSCLREPNSTNMPLGSNTNTSASGNYGVFFANASQTLSSSFLGENPNGTWTIYAWESTTAPPCISSASLTFGNSEVKNETTIGETCATAIEWQGGPICASTNGKSSSTLMPGSLPPHGTSFGTIGGQTCSWNGNNNNDVWIRFVPETSGNTCISISGLTFSLQSLIVTDANADGDNNPCTYTGTLPSPAGNDPRWTLISCPDPSVYTTSAGTSRNQQHCFNATANQTYYLVVDGNGGAESDFYITGTLGNYIPLSVNLVYFKGEKRKKENVLYWKTTQELNFKSFEIEKSTNGLRFESIGVINAKGENGLGANYTFVDNAIRSNKCYYRLKRIDMDDKYTYSNIVQLSNSKAFVEVFPNPAQTNFTIQVYNEQTFDEIVIIELLDMNGKVLRNYSMNKESQIANMTIQGKELSSGLYLLRVYTGNEVIVNKIVKQ